MHSFPLGSLSPCPHKIYCIAIIRYHNHIKSYTVPDCFHMRAHTHTHIQVYTLYTMVYTVYCG